MHLRNILALTISLAACGGSTEPAVTPAQLSGTYTLTFTPPADVVKVGPACLTWRMAFPAGPVTCTSGQFANQGYFLGLRNDTLTIAPALAGEAATFVYDLTGWSGDSKSGAAKYRGGMSGPTYQCGANVCRNREYGDVRYVRQ